MKPNSLDGGFSEQQGPREEQNEFIRHGLEKINRVVLTAARDHKREVT